jgi:hypothetical protein
MTSPYGSVQSPPPLVAGKPGTSFSEVDLLLPRSLPAVVRPPSKAPPSLPSTTWPLLVNSSWAISNILHSAGKQITRAGCPNPCVKQQPTSFPMPSSLSGPMCRCALSSEFRPSVAKSQISAWRAPTTKVRHRRAWRAWFITVITREGDAPV